MQKQAELAYENNVVMVMGQLNFQNVMLLQHTCFDQIKHQPAWVFDFSRVTASDSSGLAWVIEWIKQAERTNKKISFKGLSNGIMELARASNLDVIINPFLY